MCQTGCARGGVGSRESLLRGETLCSVLACVLGIALRWDVPPQIWDFFFFPFTLPPHSTLAPHTHTPALSRNVTPAPSTHSTLQLHILEEAQRDEQLLMPSVPRRTFSPHFRRSLTRSSVDMTPRPPTPISPPPRPPSPPLSWLHNGPSVVSRLLSGTLCRSALHASVGQIARWASLPVAPTAGRHGAAQPLRALLLADGTRRSSVARNKTCNSIQCESF